MRDFDMLTIFLANALIAQNILCKIHIFYKEREEREERKKILTHKHTFILIYITET